MERFHRHAADVLAMRASEGPAIRAEAWDYLLRGVVPLVGMFALGWSASQVLAFLIVGVWGRIVSDAVKVACAFRAVRRADEHACNMRHVWAIVHSMREGVRTILKEDHPGDDHPLRRVAIDFLAGAFGTLGVVAVHSDRHAQALWTPDLTASIAFVMISQAAGAALDVWRMLHGGPPPPMQPILSFNGFVLVVLGGVMAFIEKHAQAADATWWTIVVFHALLAMLGLTSLISKDEQHDGQWLKAYLDKRKT